MNTENFNAPTKSGTVWGTVLVLILQINISSLLNTIIIAAVGATTSFLVSIGLRYLSRKYFK